MFAKPGNKYASHVAQPPVSSCQSTDDLRAGTVRNWSDGILTSKLARLGIARTSCSAEQNPRHSDWSWVENGPCMRCPCPRPIVRPYAGPRPKANHLDICKQMNEVNDMNHGNSQDDAVKVDSIPGRPKTLASESQGSDPTTILSHLRRGI